MINFLSHLGHLPRLADVLVNQRKLLKLKIQVVSIPLFVPLIPLYVLVIPLCVPLIPLYDPLLGTEVLPEREGFVHISQIGNFAPGWYDTHPYFVFTNTQLRKASITECLRLKPRPPGEKQRFEPMDYNIASTFLLFMLLLEDGRCFDRLNFGFLQILRNQLIQTFD